MEYQSAAAAATRDLQRMLNQLSHRHPQLPRLAITGIFDEPTLEAVMIFQRDFGLLVTGVVDHASWYAIVEAYLEDLLHYGPPSPLHVLPHGEFSTPAGDSSHPFQVAQTLFCSLGSLVSNFAPCETDRRNLGPTQENLMRLQQLSGLPATGELNRATWEFLIRLYHMYVLRDVRSRTS